MARRKRQPAKIDPMPPRVGRGNACVEVFHHPSPEAKKLWYYLRAIGRVTKPPSFRHKHQGKDGFLLHFVSRGSLWHQARERRCIARAGEACLLDLSEDAAYGCETGSVVFYWALFNGPGMPQVFAELRADRSPIFTSLERSRMESLCRELLAITIGQPPAYEVRASGLLTAILAELFASRPAGVSFAGIGATNQPLSDAVRKGIDCICRFYDGDLPIKHIAMVVGKDLSYFSKLFHREVGMTPLTYLNQYRTERAKRLLESTTLPVAQIARSVGLPDQNYFARLFTQLVGVSPRKHRIDQQKRKK